MNMKHGSTIAEVMVSLAIVAVGGMLLLPRPGIEAGNNVLDSDTANIIMAIAVVAAVGCIASSRGPGKAYSWATRLGVVAWGVVVYCVAMMAMLTIIPPSVTRSLVRLLLGAN